MSKTFSPTRIFETLTKEQKDEINRLAKLDSWSEITAGIKSMNLVDEQSTVVTWLLSDIWYERKHEKHE